MSLTSSSSSFDRNKYGGIWRRSVNFFKGCSLWYCDAIYRRVVFFVCSTNRVPPYLFLSREDDHDVRNTGKHDFRSFYFTLCYLMQTGDGSLRSQTRSQKHYTANPSYAYDPIRVYAASNNNNIFFSFFFSALSP